MEEQYVSIFPERIVYGTFWQRFAASFIDGLILSIPSSLVTSFFGRQNNLFLQIFRREEITSLAIESFIVQIIMNWLYFAFMESSNAQATVGKQALGLKVTDMTGNRISFSNATYRYFGKFISTLILFIGYFMMLWDDRNQTLHDKMAGTLVVKKLPVI